MNKFFRHKKRYTFSLILSAMAIAASSCAPIVDSTGETPSDAPVGSSPFPNPSRETQTPRANKTKPSPTTKTAPFGTETPNQNKTGNLKGSDITLFTSDLQCQNLVPQKVSVSANEPVKDAVGKIIAAKNTADINISNYRVNLNNGTATVDFRIPPDSPRQLVSLSSCEQFALFRSIEKTLTSNPKWNIRNVRFTQSGEELYL